MTAGGPLVLSLFPGIGLLDRAFEEEGFCVVRGPDLIWGGDVRCFFPPAGVFDGVIGGPPCQSFSGLANLIRAKGGEPAPDMIPEFVRVVGATRPIWFLMENVPTAPIPAIDGYGVTTLLLDNRWLGEEQARKRRFSFGSGDGFRRVLHPEVAIFESSEFAPTVTSAHAGERPRTKGMIRRYTVEEARRLQGLPDDFLDGSPLTQQGKLKVIAQGVPLPMGRAVARAVKRAMGYPLSEVAS